MTKADLMKHYEQVKDKAQCIILKLHMPTSETEMIVNPNITEKIAYIDKTYNENLVHKNCESIYITDVQFGIPDDEASMDFGMALEIIKTGGKCARRMWNGKGQYIQLATNITCTDINGEMIGVNHDAIGNKAIAFVGTSGVQLGWLASQADMLASDWYEVN